MTKRMELTMLTERFWTRKEVHDGINRRIRVPGHAREIWCLKCVTRVFIEISAYDRALDTANASGHYSRLDAVWRAA
jgi:hypothetical protein